MSITYKPVKCVVVGNNSVGKTTLLIRYTTGHFCPPEEVPIVFDNYSKPIRVNDEPYALGLYDTYKPEEHDRIRYLCYPQTHVLLVCFSVVNRASFNDVECVWLDETRHFCPGVPWLLIGTRIDLRAAKDPKAYRKWNQPITTKEGRAAAKRLGASAYIECSALEQVNVKEVFEQAVIASQSPKNRGHSRKPCVVL